MSEQDSRAEFILGLDRLIDEHKLTTGEVVGLLQVMQFQLLYAAQVHAAQDHEGGGDD